MNKNNFMTPKEYKRLQIDKLVNEFKEKFLEKIGYRPDVYISKKEIKTIDLSKLEKIINSFIPEYSIEYYKIKSISDFTKRREISDLRHIFCRIAKNMGYTLISIGNHLNNRDHTTVINSCKKFENLIKTDDLFKEKYERII
jgi:chromosomal replication initiation ATPase DnaA